MIGANSVNTAPTIFWSILDRPVVTDGPFRFTIPASTFHDAETAVLGLSATLADGNSLPAWLQFAGSGEFVASPPAGFKGALDIKITATDGELSVSDTFVLTVEMKNQAPSGLAISNSVVAENTKAGTVVGYLTAQDHDATQLTYRLLNDLGGRFAIDGNKVVVTGALNFEVASSHRLFIEVTDAQGATFTTRVISIDISDVAERIRGSNGADKLNGGAGADILSGGLGKDKLYGLEGNDRLHGGAESDMLVGGLGKDAFVFDIKPSKSNVDWITDYTVKADSIYLDNGVFTKLGKMGSIAAPSEIKKSLFTIGTKAADKNDYLVYNKKTGALSYDADGSGSGKSVKIATLPENLKMTYHDFFVI